MGGERAFGGRHFIHIGVSSEKPGKGGMFLLFLRGEEKEFSVKEGKKGKNWEGKREGKVFLVALVGLWCTEKG